MAKTVVVTGAAMGIGRAILEKLVDKWHVVAVDIAPMDELARQYGDRVTTVTGSVTDEQTHEDARAAAVAAGELLGWVNNAAQILTDEIATTEIELYHRIVDVNITGTWLGSREAIRAFLKGGGGALVNVGSIHGRRGFPEWSTYDMSKGAIEGLSRQLAVQYGPKGIRVNVVAPGAIWTPTHERLRAAAPNTEDFDAALEGTPPLRRVGKPEEIAAATAFLLSDEAAFITGESLAVDGGWTAG